MPGQYGAPLRSYEVNLIGSFYPTIKKYLSPKNILIIEEEGFIIGSEPYIFTPAANQKECVYSFYDSKSIARCGFEKAFQNGEINWQKPISCHLFPIRVSYGSTCYLRYERLNECKSSIEYGKQTKMLLVDFLRSALIRAFGEDWYNLLTEQVRSEQYTLESTYKS